MKAAIVLTTFENGKLVETVVGHTTVTMHTDYEKLIGKLGAKQFGGDHVVRDMSPALFPFKAVNSNGDTVHIL